MKKFLYISFLTIHICAFIKCSQPAHTFPRQGGIVDHLEAIERDPAFNELQTMHQAYKEKIESLYQGYKQKKALLEQRIASQPKDVGIASEMDVLEFELKKNKDDSKAEFDLKKKELKSKYRTHRLYSIIEAQGLIELLRKLQKEEESPIENKYLFTKSTYNRGTFDKERKKIERKYEVFREYIRTFSQEPRTPREQELLQQLQAEQEKYKKKWYDLKKLWNPEGQETFEKEKLFQDKIKRAMSEYKKRYRKLLMQYKQLEDIMAPVESQDEEQAAVSSQTRRFQVSAFPKIARSKL